MSPCPHGVPVHAWQDWGGVHGGGGCLPRGSPLCPSGWQLGGQVILDLSMSHTHPQQPLLPPCPGGATLRLSRCQAQCPSPVCSPFPCCRCHRALWPAWAAPGTCPWELPVTSAHLL